MTFNVRQFLAWVLIIVGLGIIFWDISSSYFYFTAQEKFPQLFVENTIVEGNTSSTGTTIQDQIGNVVKDQISQMIPKNTVSQLLNISSWTIFATFLLWAGGKLIKIGGDLLKNNQNGNRKDN